MLQETKMEYRSPAGMSATRIESEFSPESEIVKTEELRLIITSPLSISLNKFRTVEVRGGIWVARKTEPARGVYYTGETTYDENGDRRISAVDYALDGKGGVRIDRHLHRISRHGDNFGDIKWDDLMKEGKKMDLSIFSSILLPKPYGLDGEVTFEDETQAPVLKYVELTQLPFRETFSILSNKKDRLPEINKIFKNYL